MFGAGWCVDLGGVMVCIPLVNTIATIRLSMENRLWKLSIPKSNSKGFALTAWPFLFEVSRYFRGKGINSYS